MISHFWQNFFVASQSRWARSVPCSFSSHIVVESYDLASSLCPDYNSLWFTSCLASRVARRLANISHECEKNRPSWRRSWPPPTTGSRFPKYGHYNWSPWLPRFIFATRNFLFTINNRRPSGGVASLCDQGDLNITLSLNRFRLSLLRPLFSVEKVLCTCWHRILFDNFTNSRKK